MFRAVVTVGCKCREKQDANCTSCPNNLSHITVQLSLVSPSSCGWKQLISC